MTSRDGGWAWWVLFASTFQLFIAALPYSIGMYVNELITELRVDHSFAGFFGALHLAAIHLGGSFTFLSNRFTHRVVLFTAGVVSSVSVVASVHIYNIYVLLFTFSIIPGLCIGIFFVQSMIMVNRYFDKYSSFANGIALAGCGFGFILVPHIFDQIIEVYGWRHSLYIVSGITLQGCVFAMFMRPISINVFECAIDANTSKLIEPQESQEDMEHKKSERDINCKLSEIDKSVDVVLEEVPPLIGRKQLLSNPQFYMFLVCNTLWSIAMGVVYVLGPNLFYERNMSNGNISLLMSLMGIGNFSSRIVLAGVLHFRKWNVVAIHAINSAILGVVVCMFVVYSSFSFYLVISITFGMFYGATVITQSLVPRELGGVHYYGLAYSFAIGFCVIGITGGPPLSGFIFDVSRSYEIAFTTNGAMGIVGALLLGSSFYMGRCYGGGDAKKATITIDLTPDEIDMHTLALDENDVLISNARENQNTKADI